MKFQQLFRQIERFSRLLANTPNVILSGAGGVVLAGSLVAGAAIERKDVAVAVATAGTFVGTALLSFFLPKFLYTMKVKELEQAARDAAAKERLIKEERKNREAERRLADAEQQITRLEGMRINLDTFRSILKLGLLEVDMRITDHVRKPLGRTERHKLDPRKDFQAAYVGVFTLPIRAQLGIDLAKVRLKENPDGQIIISNVIPYHDVNALESADWKLDEVRSEYLENERIVEVSSQTADLRCRELAREHEAQVRTRLKEGLDFQSFGPATIKAAEQVLRALLKPLGKEIVFSKEPGLEGEQILNFLENHNRHLQLSIEERRKQLGSPQVQS